MDSGIVPAALAVNVDAPVTARELRVPTPVMRVAFRLLLESELVISDVERTPEALLCTTPVLLRPENVMVPLDVKPVSEPRVPAIEESPVTAMPPDETVRAPLSVTAPPAVMPNSCVPLL